MSVLINSKICDNAKECGGIEACKFGAIFWDKEKGKISVDNSKCTCCGMCEDSCPIGAIRMVRSEEEYEEIRKEIDEDTRKTSDLFVDRYGAMPIDSNFLIKQEDFDAKGFEGCRLLAVEIFNQDSIRCLLSSIPIKELFTELDVKMFRKIEAKDDTLMKMYEITKLPALLFFAGGNLVGKIEGYFRDENKKELKKMINELLC